MSRYSSRNMSKSKTVIASAFAFLYVRNCYNNLQSNLTKDDLVKTNRMSIPTLQLDPKH